MRGIGTGLFRERTARIEDARLIGRLLAAAEIGSASAEFFQDGFAGNFAFDFGHGFGGGSGGGSCCVGAWSGVRLVGGEDEFLAGEAAQHAAIVTFDGEGQDAADGFDGGDDAARAGRLMDDVVAGLRNLLLSFFLFRGGVLADGGDFFPKLAHGDCSLILSAIFERPCAVERWSRSFLRIRVFGVALGEFAGFRP